MLRRAKPWFGIEYHDDTKHGFNNLTPDDEWLSMVGQKGWVVISHDRRFHTDSLALEAVRQHGVRVFYLCGAPLKTWDKLRIFAQTFKRMEKIIADQKPPYIYQVSYADRVTRVRGV